MFDDNLQRQVKNLAFEELKSANHKFPLFASNHEACGVMYEEFEETHEQLELCAEHLEKAWTATRSNDDPTFEEECVKLEREAMLLACEAIQLAAMARKALMSQDVRKVLKSMKKDGGENGF